MYVTRRLSFYLRDPSALSLPPPEGPNSGILVIQDEEAQPTCCFGLCYSDQVKNFPFPQNYNLNVRYTTQAGQHQSVSVNRVAFIPVLNQPLSSNQYYCIERAGKNKGKAYINSKEEDKTTCCFCNCINDFEPAPLAPQDTYQQFEIQRRDWGGFVGKSTTSDGYPPNFLRRKGWRLYTTSPLKFDLNEAQGVDNTLRFRLPDSSNISLSQKTSQPVVVGKWYCPFMFIKDGAVQDQFDSSRYYEMTLQQKWEQIFACENNNNNEGNAPVIVDVAIENEVVKIGSEKIMYGDDNLVDGVMWFGNVGLSSVIIERIKWEEERFGWISGSQKEVKIKRVEEFRGAGEWKKFGCYVLVESFVLKRMNGSLLLTYEFRHTQHVTSKWE
ncbi:hypothetical protein JCGZ_18246 [Jatropha curcas]|uniref:Insecticidal crystal toxin domain-containing protein n=1 Tax=Jatropha curcas TaxID=180498 RepID=A0A067KAP2_JATCU|nr:uncharacterized protein LOC105641939 [Jatropha curcas]KDP29325.1 hypothetical protein JCGZ_18246 [Jatropha curcas]